MFRIGEFSKLTQVSIRMLRYYDEIGLLKPAKVDSFTGYRMYSANQIPLLQKIILLRDSKFTTAEIQNIILKDEEVNLVAQLKKKKQEINEEIRIEKQRIKRINNFLKEIENDKFKSDFNVNVKKVNKMWILSIRDIIPNYFDEGVLWEKLCEFIDKEKISVRKTMYSNVAIYHDIEHKDNNVDVEVGMIVEKPGQSKGKFIYREVELVEKMAYTMVYGPYTNLSKGYESLAYYLESHNMQMAELPSRQICHIGVDDTKDPSEYLTEIQIPLK
ncbi:MAG: MerR family transcriptional regulator [Clostridiaceae bacterium]|nr:MerR family transcriptional regulator [Clostridiaceae bacterium]